MEEEGYRRLIEDTFRTRQVKMRDARRFLKAIEHFYFTEKDGEMLFKCCYLHGLYLAALKKEN